MKKSNFKFQSMAEKISGSLEDAIDQGEWSYAHGMVDGITAGLNLSYNQFLEETKSAMIQQNKIEDLQKNMPTLIDYDLTLKTLNDGELMFLGNEKTVQMLGNFLEIQYMNEGFVVEDDLNNYLKSHFGRYHIWFQAPSAGLGWNYKAWRIGEMHYPVSITVLRLPAAFPIREKN